MLRRLVTNKKLLVIVPVVLALALAGLFLPARKVSIEPYGMLSLESKITLSVGYEAAHASPALPVYQEFTEAKADAVLSVVVAKPAGTVNGDLLVAGMTTDGATSLTPPAGWTEISQGISGNKMTSGSWWKIASSELADYTFQTSSSEAIYIFILRITGAHPTAPVHVSAFATDTSAAPTCPTVTTTVADTLVLRLFGADEKDITVDSGYPTGHTGITVDESGGSQPASGGAAYVPQPTASATGTASFTLTASEEWYATTIAIKPPEPDISVSPTIYDFEVVPEGATPSTTTTYFTIDNNSSMQTDQTISVTTNTWSGGNGWTHSDAGIPGANTAALLANKGEAWGTNDIIVKYSSPNFIYENCPANTDYSFGLKLLAPISFTDGVQKQITVRITAVAG